MGRLRVSRPGRTIATGSRRLAAWGIGTGSTTGIVFTTSGSAFIGTVITPTEARLTVVRMRGEFMGYLRSASALGDGFSGAFGIGLATQAAVAAGITSVPTPLTEEGSDNWLYHRYFHLAAPGQIDTTAAESVSYGPAFVRFEVDTKAMRKMTDTDSLYAAIEVTLNPTAVAEFFFNSRTLSKLA